MPLLPDDFAALGRALQEDPASLRPILWPLAYLDAVNLLSAALTLQQLYRADSAQFSPIPALDATLRRLCPSGDVPKPGWCGTPADIGIVLAALQCLYETHVCEDCRPKVVAVAQRLLPFAPPSADTHVH